MRLFLAFAVALSLVAVPAAAQEESPHITDPCGDALVWARAGDETVGSPDPVSPDFDVEAADIRAVRDGAAVAGVDLVLRVCGEITEPAFGQRYLWTWLTPAGCRQEVSYSRSVRVVVPTEVNDDLWVTYTETCPTGRQDLIFTEVEQTFEERFVADEVATVDGDTLTVTLRRDALPEIAHPALTEGARWLAPAVGTQIVWTAGSYFVRDPDAEVIIRGGDSAGGADFTLG
jgi:hypothetical protein